MPGSSPAEVTVSTDLLRGDPPTVAPLLLNKVLRVGELSARIVEVEAYWGSHDPASHAFGGMTARNATMFGRAGLLYVYRSYGIHWCSNIVLGAEGEAAAVLVRAVEPIAGIDLMAARRPRARLERDLSNGPGKLCAALGITGDDDANDLLDPDARVRLVDTGLAPPDPPGVTTRIGITRAVDRPWRFLVPGNRWVSRGRPAGG